MTTPTYEVAIIGGGISGCALFFTLARYTDVASVALFEKYDSIAPLNSNARANSQTLHCGDIETNYTLDKARRVKQIAGMVLRYGELASDARSAMGVYPKMVLGVGEREVTYLRRRHEEFSAAFPYMQLWEAERIAELEPAVAMVDGKLRPEPIVASGTTTEVCAVDFGKLSTSFVRNAEAEQKQTDLHLGTKVQSITEQDGEFLLATNRGPMHARALVISAGPHSLLYAHRMGYGLQYSILPMAGSFYFVPKRINGKVYTVQNPKLPFAALHADPDMVIPDRTRIGPTALILPKMERYRPGTYGEFFKVLKPDMGVARVLWDLLKDRDIRNYILRNVLFELPLVRRRLFLKDVRKIIPSLRLEELEFAKGFGGLRPQVIDRENARLQLGEASINPGTGVIFNLTPSPGASTCLGNAYRDALSVTAHLGRTLDRDRLLRELLAREDLYPA